MASMDKAHPHTGYNMKNVFYVSYVNCYVNRLDSH